MASERIGVVTGLRAEARVARHLGWMVAVGGGSSRGAERAARSLVEQGAQALVSFGLAGGLDLALRPGAILVPGAVLFAGASHTADRGVAARLGGATAPGATLLGLATPVATAADKRRLHAETAAAAVDLESGPVAEVAAEHGLPFAALRAICDPAERSLPAAALTALSEDGAIRPGAMLAALRREPGQITALLALARDAAAARRGLLRHLRALRRCAA